jgi:ATP-dependent RNA helicase SUPV3L1/SUV3
VDGWIDRRLGPLLALARAAREPGLGGSGRGIAFRLAEHLGSLARDDAASLVDALAEDDRRALARLGVRFGLIHLFVPELLRPSANEARARLLRVFHGRAIDLPAPGRTVLRPQPSGEPADVVAIGFAPHDGFALRVDVLERVAARVRELARAGPSFAVPPELAAEAGLTRAELTVLVERLGFRATPEAGAGTFARPARPPRPRHRDAKAEARRRATSGAPASPFAALARLKVAP